MRAAALAEVLGRAALPLFCVLYPFAVYWVFTRSASAGGARGAALALLGLLALAFVLRALRLGSAARSELGALSRQHLGIAALIGLAALSNSSLVLLLLPSALSLYLLVTFGASLRSERPMIERFARSVEPDFPDFKRSYCRRVTWLWCGFFALNALVAAGLALFASLGAWTLYTGGIFYALLGGLFGGEWLLRQWWFRDFGQDGTGRALAGLFPPERTERGRRSLAYRAERRESVSTRAS